jgi:hypothetical protein
VIHFVIIDLTFWSAEIEHKLHLTVEGSNPAAAGTGGQKLEIHLS